jgi:hypothetical protein
MSPASAFHNASIPKMICRNAQSTQRTAIAESVEVKIHCSANNMIMELYRFAPNIIYPDHILQGPEFVYLLEGSARQDGKWLEAGWASSAETGTLDSGFLSGEKGCLTVAVYTRSKYI